MDKLCQHKLPPLLHVTMCPHALSNEQEYKGTKFYTGKASAVEYQCSNCNEKQDFKRYAVCSECLNTLEEKDWYLEGLPEVKKALRPFTFTQRTLQLEPLASRKILRAEPLKVSTSALVLFDDQADLWRLDVLSGDLHLIANLPEIHCEGLIQIKTSSDDRFLAITSEVHRQVDVSVSNTGVIVDLYTREKCMDLDCGDYHTELTAFPVDFFVRDNKHYVMHATDWNRLDITDLSNFEIVTSREFNKNEDGSDDEDIFNDSVFTEWHGELVISPDNERVATIGWIWHPVGVAFSFSISQWMDNYIFEPDYGKSKRSYAIWSYFWFSPIFWLDNERLCIWGAIGEGDDPPNCVVVFNAETEKALYCFSGPTMHPFYYDRYLFSGLPGEKQGLSIWSMEEGTLLHTEEGLVADAYMPGTKEFITFGDAGELLLFKWQE